MFGTALTSPLKVFVHVPKTAGSTVNAHLAAWARGQDHVEHLQDRPGTLRRKLTGAHWVSGHLALNKMQALMASTTLRPVEIYGLIRDPVAQVASHYNWFIEISHRGGRFFRSHAQSIQDYSAHLRASDNSDPAVVIANITAKGGQFLNLQSRYLLGDDLKFSEDTGLNRLSHYTLLSTDPSAVVSAMTGQTPSDIKRENASPYHFDRAVFDTDEVQDFLRRRHGFDMQLYARIAALSG